MLLLYMLGIRLVLHLDNFIEKLIAVGILIFTLKCCHTTPTNCGSITVHTLHYLTLCSEAS